MSDGERNATEVLDSVSNTTRVEILRALADAHSDSPNDPWLAYSELQEAVGVRDNGNFNYHLD
jgi:DNA-binding transcriptional ArsR family regulator